MAVDKLVDSTQLDSDLTSVANAIRTKGGTSAQLAFPAGFVSAIGDIPTGGGVSYDLFIKEWAADSTVKWTVYAPLTKPFQNDGYLEFSFLDNNPTNDFGNLLDVGSRNKLQVWNDVNVIHFYHQYNSVDGDNFNIAYTGIQTVVYDIDSSVEHTIRIDKDYISFDGTNVLATPAPIKNLSTVYIGSEEGSKRAPYAVLSFKSVWGE